MTRYAVVAKVPIRAEVEADSPQKAVETFWQKEGRRYNAILAPDTNQVYIGAEVVEAYELGGEE